LHMPGDKGRGGEVSIKRLVGHMSQAYHEADRLTTLVDYYGFRGVDGRTSGELELEIENGLAERITHFRRDFVKAYVQRYEFEGLLFSDTSKFNLVLDGWTPKIGKDLEKIRSQFATPEDINNNRQSAPSKRIQNVFVNGSYNKVVHGPLIAEEIGLEEIRRQCSGFDTWLKWLESWGT
ncbi:MAG: DUF4276 family protein, partial [Rhodospirillaceae bacterium]